MCDPKTDLCVYPLPDKNRYEEIQLHAPARAGRHPFLVTADLVLKAGASRDDPAQLVLAVDGGSLHDDAGVAITALQLTDAGHYRALGALPAVEGPRALYVTFPDAGLVASTTVYVDVTPPSAVIELASPPNRRTATDGGLDEVDPDAPSAFRRDEELALTIDTAERDVILPTVSVLSDGGGLQPMPSGDAGCITRFDGGSCFLARIPLWRHPMLAYRDSIGLLIRVTDDVGNDVEIDGGRVSVTRFKWTRSTSEPIGSLALNREGNLLLYPGQLMAWRPDGTNLWSQAPTGFAGLVTVGTHQNEHVYVAAVDPGPVTLESSATPFATPSQPIAPLVPRVPGAGGMASQPLIVGQPGQEVVWLSTGTEAQFNLHVWRLQDRVTGELDAGAGLLGLLFTDNGRIFGLLPADAGNTEVVSFAPGFGGVTPSIVNRLSIAGAPSSAAVAQIDLMYLTVSTNDGGFIVPVSRTNELPGRIPVPLKTGIAVVGANTVFANEAAAIVAGRPTLCSAAIGSASATCAAVRTRGAPILGASPSFGGAPILYSFGQDSAIDLVLRAVDSSSLTVLWNAPLPVRSAPTAIDCSRVDGVARAGAPGVLYSLDLTFPSRVRAIIVDSPGIDGTSRWPMVTHDPRNTGNSEMPLTPFYCP